MSRSLFSQSLGLLGWLLLTFAAAAIGAAASADAPGFYAQLKKPAWAPPASVFGPVWSVLYTLMGVSAWWVWRSETPTKPGLTLFVVQLGANALWSWLFFVWQRGAVAMAEIVVLLTLIACTMAAFWRGHRVAALLLVPYLLWVGFAALLTWSLWQRNPGLL